jgi:ribonuclease HI
MVVTINTDASFNPQYKIGGYAYWVVYNGKRVKRGGILKECQNSTEAEIKAIANALYKLTLLKFKDVFLIIVNTDCTPAVDLITGKSKTEVKGTNDAIAAIHQYVTELRISNGINKIAEEYIEYRHVKAHTKVKDKRSYVNDWCDKVAKDFVKLHILKLCQKKNSQPDRG